VHDTADGARVTVFRGLDTSLLGMDLNRVSDVTDLPVADLTPAAASKAQRGIPAADAAHAQRIVSNLREQRLPLCPTEEDVEPATVAPTVPPSPSPTPTPDGTAPTDAAPVPPEPTTPAPTSTQPTRTFEPGVDCREGE
jgi:protein phosphatase